MGEILTAFSAALQLAAAAVGLRLAWITRRTAWLPLSLAILLMGVRRSYSLYNAWAFERSIDVGAETIALVISLLMLLGLLGLYRLRRPAAKELRLQLGDSPRGLRGMNYTAIFLGLAAILGCAVVGVYAYHTSRNTILISEFENNLHRARELGARVEQMAKSTDPQQAMDNIQRAWQNIDKRYPGSYVCVITIDGRLALNTANPESVGLDLTSVSLPSNGDRNSPLRIADLIARKKDWTGWCTSPTGQQQMAAFTFLPNQNFLLAVHVPKSEIEARLRSELLPWITGLALIGLVLVPISLGLLNWAFHSSLAARQQAELALADSEKRYRSIVEDQTELVCRNLSDGTLTFVNAAYCRYFRKSYEELIGSNLLSLVLSSERDRIARNFTTLSANFPVANLEYRVVAHNGETRWQRWTNRATFDDDGKLLQILGTGRDITEQKLAELELQESQRRFQTLAENSPSILFEADAEGNSIYANPRWSVVSGLPEGKWAGKGWTEAVHPDDQQEVFRSWQEAVVAGRPWRCEFRFQHVEGAITWVLGRATPLCHEDGSLRGFIGECIDITERKKVEKIREDRNRVLEQLAAGDSLEKVLTTLAKTVQQTRPGMYCSIMLAVDDRLYLGSAPDLPEEFKQSIQGLQIGAEAGAGGATVACGDRIMVEDTQTHPHWSRLRSIAERTHLRCCWSEPIHSAKGEVVGVLSMYGSQSMLPQDDDLELLKASADVAGIAIDSHHAETALRESEQRFDLAVKGSNDGLWDWNVTSNEMWWSPRFHELLHYEPTDVEHTFPFFEGLIHAQDKPRARAAMRAHLEARQPYDIEYRLQTKTDGYRWFHARGQALWDAEGRPLRMSGSLQDITDRKQTEHDRQALLVRSRQQQAAIVRLARRYGNLDSDLMKTLQAITEESGKALNVQRTSVWLLSDDLSQLRCTNLYEKSTREHSDGAVLLSKDYPRYFAALQSGRALDAHDAHHDPRTSEFSENYLTPLGITSMLDAAIRVAGEVVGVVCSEHVGSQRRWTPDETAFSGVIADQVAQVLVERQRQQAEQARAESQQLISQLLDSTAEAIFGLDLQGNCTFCNPASLRFLGYEDASQLLGQNMHALIHHSGADGSPLPEDQCQIYKALRNGEAAHSDSEVLWRADGTSFPVEYWAHPILRDGRTFGSVMTFMDISQRKATEEQLRQQENQLAHADRLHTLGEMVAGIAHEINQPLHAISSFALANVKALEAARDDGPQDALEWSREISQQAGRAGEIIRRLRDFSMAAPPNLSPLDLNQVVQEAIELVSAEARSHGVKIQQQLDPHQPHAPADRIQIQQVLVNLLRNAIEAMRENDGKARQIMVQITSNDQQAIIAVLDTGSGLPQDEREKLFDAFFTTKPEGMGMGLAISRRIAESYGGRIKAKENPAGGAIFSFSLPLCQGVAI